VRAAVAIAGLGLLAATAAAVVGCQSTQATSAEREAEGQTLLKSEKAVKVTKQNPEMKIVDTQLISDENGSAVIVQVENTSGKSYVNVPISIDVSDAKGKSVFKNNTPGLVPSLTSIPISEAGETTTWINDQILATGEPDSVKVKVGFSKAELPEPVPEIKITQPTLANDSFSGIEADGTLELLSGPDQEDMTLFTVAKRDGKIVAAGRAGVKHLLGDAHKPTDFTTFFIGTPEKGDELTTTAPPVIFTEGQK
jgi:hypothetical protein